MTTRTQDFKDWRRRTHAGDWWAFVTPKSHVRYDAEAAAQEDREAYGWESGWKGGRLVVLVDGEVEGDYVACKSCDEVNALIAGNCYDQDFCPNCGAESK